MKIVLTCGPAWEPIDAMRRLTNASTGRLGTQLAEAFLDAGHQVHLFRGETSTAPLPRGPALLHPFGTNDDLARALEALARHEAIDALLHAAALCDFRVAAARAPDGTDVSGPKIASRSGPLLLELEPATKVLPHLRHWFPRARVVGWKYELNGGRHDALQAAWRQIAEAGTDACVVNGKAWGDGFGLCTPPDRVTGCGNAEELAATLRHFLEGR